MKKRVLIIGLGLLGGSLALALRRSGDFLVTAWARGESSRQWAVDTGAADIVFDDLDKALSEAELAVLCLPVPAAIELLPLCASKLPAGSVLTDIGSVKQAVMSAASQVSGLRFVGSHPMAGTEKSGCANSFAELYRNADVFVTPPSPADAEAVELCSAMWLAAGCARVEVIDAAKHDALVADTSHVLHLLASAMTLSILDGKSAGDQRCHFAGCATGFRDTTRIASSSPLMWREIMESNTSAVLAALERFESCFSRLRKTLQDGDFDEFERLFARGKLLRSAWLSYKKPRPPRIVLCGIKHCGKSSAGRELAELLPAPLVDSDDMIVEEYAADNAGQRLSVREIYRASGEDGFRHLENRCLELLAATPGAMVIALGGGALSNRFLKRETLNSLGEIVFVDVPDMVAWERVKANGIPPFLAEAADPYAAFAASNADRRRVFAEHAKITVKVSADESPRDVALRILSMLA